MSEIVERLRALEAAQATLITARDTMEACWKREHARVKELEAALHRIAADDESDADLNEWGAAAVARAALTQPAQPAPSAWRPEEDDAIAEIEQKVNKGP